MDNDVDMGAETFFLLLSCFAPGYTYVCVSFQFFSLLCTLHAWPLEYLFVVPA